jgi:asparagine synthetase B (glutamine-hydrolysing)
MSYIGGILTASPPGGPEEVESILLRMSQTLRHRGPERAIDARRGILAGGYSWSGWDLFSDETASLACGFDGRLDNADDLRARLGLPAAGAAELVLHAYRLWGKDFVAFLRGEFALAIGGPGTAILARDPSGIRPLFYAAFHGGLIFAPEIKAILAVSDMPVRPNEGMIADFLWGNFTTLSETFFSGIQRLPPGETLHVERGGITRTAALAPVGPSAARSFRRIRDDLSASLVSAIRKQTRSAREGLLLSGGIDSTIILERLCAERGADHIRTKLSVASSVFGRITSCDEGHLIAVTSEAYGFSPEYIPSDGLWPLREGARGPQCRRDEPLRGQFLDAFEVAQLQALRNSGVMGVFTGYGGDEVITASPWMFYDVLASGRTDVLNREIQRLPGQWADEVPAILRTNGDPARLITRDGCFTKLPERSWRLHTGRIHENGWLPDGRFGTLARWHAHRTARGFGAMVLAETARGLALEQGVHLLMPFFDPEVVDSFLSVPDELKYRAGHPKFLGALLLTSARGAKPVARQRVKSHLNALVDLGLRFRAKVLVRSMLNAETDAGRDLLPRAFIDEIHAAYLSGSGGARSMLLRVLALNTWFQEWFAD